MMASIEKQLQNLRQRLNMENENLGQNGPTPQPPNPSVNHNQNRINDRPNSGTQSTTPVRNRPDGRFQATVQQFPRRQYSLSATQRQSNNNLQLNFNQLSNNRNNNRQQNGSTSQSLNAQCLSPRPRPRNCWLLFTTHSAFN